MSFDRRLFQTAIEFASARIAEEAERFASEVEFAEQLCELHPDRAEAWRPLIEKAVKGVRPAAESGNLADLTKAVRDAEALLSPVGAVAKTYTILCAGHAHIDMNWLWSWPETVAVTNDTFGTVLRLMDEYPDFAFSQSQASVYWIIEKYNRPMLDRIVERVKEGRWEVVASHWVENDKNLAAGESLCRHLLYTRQYMKDLFGLAPEDVPIDWAPDTFGHAATIPSYLARGGVKYYYCCRPGRASQRPMAFWWQAPDGSRVLVYREFTWYNGQIAPANTQSLVTWAKGTGLRTWLNVYGVGDHGGGPTRRDIAYARTMDGWPVFPNVKLSPTRPFYEALESIGDKLPVLDEELNFEFTGCYTSQSKIKLANRLGTLRLCDAESAASIAWLAFARPYPGAALRDAWRQTLFSHFHDILPGSGVHDTRTYAHGMFQEVAATAGSIETQSLRHLASMVRTSGPAAHEEYPWPAAAMRSALGAGVGYGTDGASLSAAEQTAGCGPRPFVVFNPTSWDRSGIVTATIWDNEPERRSWIKSQFANRLSTLDWAVRTPSGELVRAQKLESGGYWGHTFLSLAFPAAAVPGLGYALYTVVEGAAQPGGSEARLGDGLVLENDLLRVELDAETGGIRSLVEKRSWLNLVRPGVPAGRLELTTERPHGMTAWVIEQGGPPAYAEVTGIKRGQSGPYLAWIDVSLRVCESTFVLRYEVRAGDPRLYLALEGTWVERGSAERGVPSLRIAFPLALDNAAARYEIPFGAISREQTAGEEVPALQWAHVWGKAHGVEAGCLLVNDSKHGHSLDGSTLRLSLIRSSYDPDPLPEVGQHAVRLALCPFAGDMSVSRATRLAAEANQPLRPVGTDVHGGTLGAEGRFIAIEPESLILSGLKKAEDSNALIVRLYEADGRETMARIRISPELCGGIASAREVDLLERPCKQSSVRLDGDTVTVRIPAHGIATVMLRMKKR